jgi:hypothetical protein
MGLKPANALQIRGMGKRAGMLLIVVTVASEVTDILGHHRDVRLVSTWRSADSLYG